MFARDLIVYIFVMATILLNGVAGSVQAAEWDDGITRTPGNYGPIPLITLNAEYENFAVGPYVVQGELVLRICRDTQASTDTTIVAAVPRLPTNPQFELKQLYWGCGDIEGRVFYVKSITTKYAGLAGIIKPDSLSGWSYVRLTSGYGGDHVLVNVRTPQKYIIKIPEKEGPEAYKVQFKVYSKHLPLGRTGWLHSNGANARIIRDALKVVALQTKFEDDRNEKVEEKTIRYARCDSSIVKCEGNKNSRDKKDDAKWLEGGDSSD